MADRTWVYLRPVRQPHTGWWVALAESSCGRFTLRGRAATAAGAMERLRAEVALFDAMSDDPNPERPS